MQGEAGITFLYQVYVKRMYLMEGMKQTHTLVLAAFHIIVCIFNIMMMLMYIW